MSKRITDERLATLLLTLRDTAPSEHYRFVPELLRALKESRATIERVRGALTIINNGAEYCSTRSPERSGGIEWAGNRLKEALGDSGVGDE